MNKMYMKRKKPNYKEPKKEEVEFRGPRRKAGENERWQKFNDSSGKTIVYLKKIKPSIKDIQDVLTAPFLDDVEKQMQLTKIGAGPSQISQARLGLRLRRIHKRRY